MNNGTNLSKEQVRTVALVLMEQQEKQADVDMVVSLTKAKLALQSDFGLSDDAAWQGICLLPTSYVPKAQIQYDYLANLAKVEAKVLAY